MVACRLHFGRVYFRNPQMLWPNKIVTFTITYLLARILFLASKNVHYLAENKLMFRRFKPVNVLNIQNKIASAELSRP